jgi:hypothetical protein
LKHAPSPPKFLPYTVSLSALKCESGVENVNFFANFAETFAFFAVKYFF